MPKRYQQRQSSSSPGCSTSSHDDAAIYCSDRFFEPEYAVTDINAWRSTLSRNEMPSDIYYSHPSAPPSSSSSDVRLHHGAQTSASNTPFLLDASSLYPTAPIAMTTQQRPAPASTSRSRVTSPLAASASLGKHPLHPPSSHSYSGQDARMLDQDEGTPPGKRSKKEQSVPNGRVSGACTRCKRLKMKCTFADDDKVCARCIVGGHECVVLGRKPRSPGMREILRKQIREKDAMIDNLLARLNPASSMATPLAITPARLALTPEQRNVYRDVLAYYEKSQNLSKSAAEVGRKFDVSALDEDSEYDSESDGSNAAMDDLQENAAALHIHPLPATEAPAGLLAKTALESKSRLGSPASARGTGSEVDGQDDQVSSQGGGIGNLAYFEPGPSSNLDLRRLIVERQAAPDILLSGLVTNEDVGKLFDIYWKWINPVIPILDENIHTAAAVLGRCPFLFTVICAISSRFYDEKPEIYAMAIHMVKAAAANAFLDGWKTVEMCQAFALMASYMPPARRWDEDRTWFYSGVAFRLAIDLDLGRMPTTAPVDERGERELLNRLRTYVVCFIIDRCFCLNLGKPCMMPEDEFIRSVATQFYGRKYSCTSDGYLTSLVELLRIMGRFPQLANPAAQAACDDVQELVRTHRIFTEELNAWNNIVMQRCATEHLPNAPADDRIRMALLTSVYQYCRLITYSTCLQHVVKLGKLNDDSVFFAGCLHAGSAVINCVMDRIIPTGFIRYSPDYVFALSAFGTAVLIKCMRPEFASKLDRRQEARITEIVKRLTKALDSDQVGVDDQATPRRSYARFLDQVLTSCVSEKQKKTMQREGQTHSHSHSNGHNQSQSQRQNSNDSVSQSPQDGVFPITPTHSPSLTQPAPIPEIKMNDQFALPPSDHAFLQAWEMMDMNNPMAGANINSLLGFPDNQLPPGFMSFPDHSWFM